MDTQQLARLDQRTRAVVEAFGAPSVLDATRLLIRARAPVFPCALGVKRRPLVAHGFRDASTDPLEIQRWFRRWPEANLAIPTGRVSGWDVVDVDVHDGGTRGPDAFRASLARGLTAGWAFTVRTPSGGLHAWFPNTGEQSCWQVPQAYVDVRSDGGYVLVPPSRVEYDDHSSGVYHLASVARRSTSTVDGTALRASLAPPVQPLHVTPLVGSAAREGADPQRLADWVAARPEGGRNAGLFWAACRLAEHPHD